MTDQKDFQPIDNYGLIGDCRSAALVGSNGSIDWCCFPRFDSPSVFAAILDPAHGGQFAITPVGPYASSQRYVPDTNVLETQFSTASGTCRITDFMPLYSLPDGTVVARHQIVRRIEGLHGGMELAVRYAPRPDYAREPGTVQVVGGEARCAWQDASLTLTSPITLALFGENAEGTIKLTAGKEALFVLTYRDPALAPLDTNMSPAQLEDATVRFWRNVAAEVDYEGLTKKEELMRSYLVLHLLTYDPSGGIVAAPTTSLPEAIGGERNWDYRYTWLRDAAFTVEALMSLGHLEEATGFFRWLCQVCTECAERRHLQIMFRVDGGSDLEEQELDHLAGYRNSRPVRIGNQAALQRQHDIYGEVLASAHLLFSQDGFAPSDADWDLLRMLANMAVMYWREPDNGIWEVRGGPYHFVYSKVMCWVALDRAVRLAEATGTADAETQIWAREAQAIKEEVLTKGWSDRKQAFVQHYDTDAMDASNLLIPLMGFLPADDPRVVSTVERIRSELGYGPFLHRYRTEETDDGLAGGEGAFTLCSFWLVRVLAQMGRAEEAQHLLEQLLTLASPLGLYAEMVDPQSKEALGNYPQAFTHIGLILAVQALQQSHVRLEEKV